MSNEDEQGTCFSFNALEDKGQPHIIGLAGRLEKLTERRWLYSLSLPSSIATILHQVDGLLTKAATADMARQSASRGRRSATFMWRNSSKKPASPTTDHISIRFYTRLIIQSSAVEHIKGQDDDAIATTLH